MKEDMDVLRAADVHVSRLVAAHGRAGALFDVVDAPLAAEALP